MEWTALEGRLSSIQCLGKASGGSRIFKIWEEIYKLETAIYDQTTKEQITSSHQLSYLWNCVKFYYTSDQLHEEANRADRQVLSSLKYASFLGDPKATRILNFQSK